jgi:inhibitor of cysteine peptidase
MKKLLLCSIYLTLLFLSAACAGQVSTPVVSTYAETNPAAPLEATAGSEFYIAVPSNPSTGYHWEVMSELDPTVVKLQSNEYVSASADSMPGSGGMDIWHLAAVGAGEAEFTVSSFPPSDPNTAEQTLTFTIKVK